LRARSIIEVVVEDDLGRFAVAQLILGDLLYVGVVNRSRQLGLELLVFHPLGVLLGLDALELFPRGERALIVVRQPREEGDHHNEDQYFQGDAPLAFARCADFTVHNASPCNCVGATVSGGPVMLSENRAGKGACSSLFDAGDAYTALSIIFCLRISIRSFIFK